MDTPSHRSSSRSEAPDSDAETRTVGVSSAVVTSAIGDAVSRYVVLEEIGRGGMGRVLRAYDPVLQREVALKELRGDALDDTGTRRLVAEARAMAKLSHPNVVAVYDVEELPSGEVVLVMELVAGQTLRRWLRDEEHPWPAIIQRFIAAGRGLEAAHAAGLLHRDFKPANVLVTGARGAKVTDFGLAKLDASMSASADSHDEGTAEELTQAGLVMGTPRYMAPEQYTDEVLGAAADQYAFCIAVWEALCGEPPFAGPTMADDKLEGPGAWSRSGIPRPIVDAIRRGLSPQPDDRWPSMEVLLEALAFDPARRRTRWLMGAGATAVVGVAGVAYGAWLDARGRRCSGAEQKLAGVWDEDRSAAVQAAILGIDRSYAERAWEQTKEVLDAYATEWAAMHTEACEATAVRGEQSAELLDLRMACLHRAAVELNATVDTIADADAAVLDKLHDLTRRLPELSRCADAATLTADVEPPAPEDAEAVEAARVELARAESIGVAGRYEQSRQALELAKSHVEGIDYAPLRIELDLHEGRLAAKTGKFEVAEAALRSSLATALRWKRKDVAASAASELMYVVGYDQQRIAEGLTYRPLVEGLVEGRPGPDEHARNYIAAILLAAGKYEEAEAELRTLLSMQLAADDPQGAAMTRNNLALALMRQEKLAEAETEQRAAAAALEPIVGAAHPIVASGMVNVGSILLKAGKLEEAEAALRDALPRVEGSVSEDHPGVAMTRNSLAGVLSAQGKHAEAEAQLRAALALREKRSAPDHPFVAMLRYNLANVLVEDGRDLEALPLAEQAWQRRQRDDIPKERRAGAAWLLANILWDVPPPDRDRARARELARTALGSFREAGEAHAHEVVEVQEWLASHHVEGVREGE